VNVYDLIGISELEREEDDETYQGRALQAVLRFVRKRQTEAVDTSEAETATDATRPPNVSDHMEEPF